MKNLKFTILTISLLILTIKDFYSQTTTTYVKPQSSAYYDSLNILRPIKIFDRFDNEYLPKQIAIQKKSIYINDTSNQLPVPQSFPYQKNPAPCVSGMFEIYFAPDASGFGFNIQSNRDVVCQVFKDLSRLIYDNNTTNGAGRVKIYVSSDVANNQTMGTNMTISSSFRVLPQGIMHTLVDNEIGKTIKGGKNSYENVPYIEIPYNSDGLFHGLIYVNFTNYSWYDDYSNLNIGINEKDLYSSILHEAMNMIGIQSLMQSNGSGTGAGVYGLMDQYLTNGNSTTKLITFNSTTNQWLYSGGLSNLATGCGNTNSIYLNGNNLTGQSVYSDAPFRRGINLNYLSCNTSPLNSGCSGYSLTAGNTFSTAFCSDLGADYIKRRPHANEVKLLCDLGYSLKNINGVYAYGDISTGTYNYSPASSNSTIYQTYSNCTVNNCFAVGYSDIFSINLGSTPSTLTIPISNILANDYNGTLINSSNIKNLTPSLGTAIISGSNIVFTPNTSGSVGRATLAYYPKCSNTGIDGSIAYIFIDILPPLVTCTPNCNMVCNGDFEGSNYSKSWCNFYFDDLNSYQSPDLYAYISGTSYFRNPSTGALVNLGNGLLIPAGGSQFFRFTAGYNGSNSNLSEAVTLKLNQPMLANKPYNLSYYAKGDGPGLDMYVYGDNNPVCSPFQGATLLNGNTSVCGFTASLLHTQSNISTSGWQQYTMSITPSKDITNLVIVSKYNANPLTLISDWVSLDEVEIHPEYTVTLPTTYPTLCYGSTQVLTPVITPNTFSYTYQWKRNGVAITGATASTYSATLSGVYTIEVSVNGCTKSANTTIIISSQILPNANTTMPTCGMLNGAITLNPSGGTSPYTYVWSNSTSNMNSRVGLPMGAYAVTITDANNCTISNIYNLSNSNSTITITPTIISPKCFSPNGSISLICNGGTIPYTYLWSNSSNVSNSRTGLSAGNYTVTVTDANGCTATNTITLTVTNSTIVINPTIINSTCNQSNGSIVLNPTGGTTPYTYLWNNGAITQNRTTLSAGTYTVTVKDANLCSASGSYTLTTSNVTINPNPSTVSATCNNPNGSITLNPSGGFSPYSYTWSGAPPYSQYRGNLNSGIYYVTIVDNSGCSKVANVNVPNVNAPSFTVSLSLGDLSCVNNFATVVANVTGANSALSYQWSTGTGNFSSTNNAVQGSNCSVTVTDASGCSATASFTVPNISSFIGIGAGTPYPSVLSAAWGVAGFGGKTTYKNFRVVGDLIIDRAQDFYYCNFAINAGVKIIVINNKNLHFSYNNFFSCSNQLWKGIEVTNNAGVTLLGNRVKDALVGVEIQGTTLMYFIDNIFENNVAGVYLKNTVPNTVNTLFRPISGNIFKGSSTTNLKLPYANMPVISGTNNLLFPPNTSCYTKPWAGIISQNSIGFEIGNTSKPKNTFTDLTNGIIAFGGNFKIQNTEFINMNKNPNTALSNYEINGNAISMQTNNISVGPPTLEVIGFGKSANNPTISNSVTGIYSNGYSVKNISQCKITGVEKGIIYNNYPNGLLNTFNASYNTINATYYGIKAKDQSLKNFNSELKYNTLAITSLKTDAVAIDISKGTNPSNNIISVENNVISGTSKLYYGISLQNLKSNNSIKNNIISMSFPEFSYAGISYNGVAGLIDYNNSITSVDKNRYNTTPPLRYFPVGILSNSTMGSISCDYVNDISSGVRFTGKASSTKITNTSFNNHYVGLRLDVGSEIFSPHTKAGNTFNGACTYEAYSNQMVKTRFNFYNTASQFNPSPKFPVSGWWFNILSSPTQWETGNCFPTLPGGGGSGVIVIGGSNFVGLASGEFTPIGISGLPIEGLKLNTTDTSILTNTMIYGTYESSLIWQGRLELYNKLKPFEPEFIDSTILKEYIVQIENGSINEFTEIQVLDKIAHSEPTSLQNYQTIMNNSWNEISVLDSVLFSTTDSVLIDSLVGVKFNKLEELRLNYITMDSLALVDSLIDAPLVDSLIAINTSIEPQGIAEVLQKDFNLVYYNTLGKRIKEFTPSQIVTYQTLANRCPLENANVVYQSRAIMDILYDSIIYEDSVICAQYGIEVKNVTKPLYYSTKTKPLSATLYPNPTKTNSILQFSEIPKNKLTLVINDLSGRTISKEEIPTTSNVYEIKSQAWSNGLYYIRIDDGTRTLFNMTLQINKEE